MHKGDQARKLIPNPIKWTVVSIALAIFLLPRVGCGDGNQMTNRVNQPVRGDGAPPPAVNPLVRQIASGQVTPLPLPYGKITRWEWKKGSRFMADPSGPVEITTLAGQRWPDGPGISGPVVDSNDPRNLIWFIRPLERGVTIMMIE